MEATVYRARHSGSVAVIDFRIVSTLEALSEALADGWHPSEVAARAALVVAAPSAVEAEAATLGPGTDASEEAALAEGNEPEPAADDAPKRTARKKR